MIHQLSTLKKKLKLIIFAITAFVVAYLIHSHLNEFQAALSNISYKYIAIICFWQIIFIAALGLPFKQLCTIYQVRLKFIDWAGISFIATMLNQIFALRPGIGFRFYYLMKKFKLSFAKIVHLNALFFGMSFIISILMLVIFIPFTNINLPINDKNLLILTVLALGFLGLLITAVLFIKFKNSKFLNLKILTALVSKSPLVLLKSLGCMLIVRSLAIVAHYYAFLAIGADLSFSVMAVIVALITLSSVVFITPGNIGVAESFVGMITSQLYGDFSLGFSAIAVYRVCNILTACVIGCGFSYALLGHILPNNKELAS